MFFDYHRAINTYEMTKYKESKVRKKFNTIASLVERAIEVTWNRVNIDSTSSLFGYIVSMF